jgi:hypothetical protein
VSASHWTLGQRVDARGVTWATGATTGTRLTVCAAKRAAAAVEMVERVECPAAGAAQRAAENAEETAEVATAIAVGSAEVKEGVGRMHAGEEDDVALLDVWLSDSDSEGGGVGGDGRRWRGRECVYCERWQPLRAKHCHDCGRCVQRFDHHCFWVGTCIGRHNHRRFWWYLTSEVRERDRGRATPTVSRIVRSSRP